MRHKTTQALYTYWNDVRNGRMAPRRFEIEPASMGDALPDTFILERTDAATFPFRLAGTRMCERFKREFRGHNFLNSWTADDTQTLRSRLNTISLQGGVVLVLVEAETAKGKSVTAEFLMLPLIHGQNTADRFLGVFCPLDEPSWLGYDPIETLRILSDEIIWPDGHPLTADSKLAERQAPFLPRMRHARIVRSEHRQFRVFDGGLCTRPDPAVPPKS